MTELEEITQFVDAYRDYKGDLIPEMECLLRVSIAYGQRVGELLNVAQRAYSLKFAECLNKLDGYSDETETTRKAKLDAWCADERFTVGTLKNLYATLKQIRMSLFQSIKNRRTEPY
jgi:hypothetical protein